MIKLLAWVQQMRCTVIGSVEETAFQIVVCARFHFDVERQTAHVVSAQKRAVQSVEDPLDRDRRHVKEDARVFGIADFTMVRPLFRGRTFKHQEQETREEKCRDIQPLHDASQGKLQNFVLTDVFVTSADQNGTKMCEAVGPTPPSSVVGRDCQSSFVGISSRNSMCCSINSLIIMRLAGSTILIRKVEDGQGRPTKKPCVLITTTECRTGRNSKK